MIYHQKLRGMTTNQLGTNVLKGKLREMFQSAGLQAETKSNHSLRASGISRLYSAGVPEKLIVERSGHLSKEGVRSYERTTAQQHKTVSDWLASSKGTYVGSLAAEHVPVQDISNPPPLKMAKTMDTQHCPKDVAPKMEETSSKVKVVKDTQHCPKYVALETEEKSSKAEEVKEMFSLSGCQVTINMQF